MAWGLPITAGSGQNKVSSTSVSTGVLNPGIAVGEVALVIVAADNTSTTDGDNGEVSSITDSIGGNTYTKVREFTNGQGAAAAGATISVWQSKISVALVALVDAVTANFGAARTAKAILVAKATIGAGNVISVAAGASLANDAADPGSMNLTPPNVEHLWVRGTALERANAAVTKTAAYEVSNAIGTTGGAAATNMDAFFEMDRLIGTTNPSDPTATAVDCASVLVALLEASSSALFNAAVNAAGTVVAAITTIISMASGVLGAAVLVAALSTNITPAAAVSGTAAVAAPLVTEIRLGSAVAGNGTTTADLTASQQSLFVADVVGTGTVAGTFSTAIQLASGVAGSAATIAPLSTAITTAAGINGTAAIAGFITTEIRFASGVAGAGTTTADLTTEVRLASGIAGAGTTTADLTVSQQALFVADVVGTGIVVGAFFTEVGLYKHSSLGMDILLKWAL